MGTSIYPLTQEAAAEASQNKLLYITHSRYENDWPSQPHIHPFAELFYVKDGCGSFLIEEEEYSIEKDDFVIVNAGISHTEVSSASMPLEYVTIGIEGLSFSFEGNKDYIIFSCKNEQKDLFFYMSAMLNEMEEKDGQTSPLKWRPLFRLIKNASRSNVTSKPITRRISLLISLRSFLT